MELEYIEFEGCHFGVLDILPKSLAQQVITQDLATELAQAYATHFGKAASELGKKATKISDITTLPPMLARENRLLILDDYCWRTDSGGVLYNLGCVFCDLAECREWDEDKTYAFLKVLYPKKVRANPSAWQDYAKKLVEKTQALAKKLA